MKDLKEVREELFKTYLPEPEGMNFLLSKINAGTIDNLKGEPPLRIKRYIYEAKEAIKYSKTNNISNLYLVVGCAHELPLEYLLKNKDLLDKFKI